MKDEMLDSADYADNLEVLLRRERAKTAKLTEALREIAKMAREDGLNYLAPLGDPKMPPYEVARQAAVCRGLLLTIQDKASAFTGGTR